MFHASLLRKAKVDPSRVLPQVPIEGKGDLTLETKLIKILEWGEKVLRNKRASLVNVLWRNTQIEEEMWEREADMKEKYPHLFKDVGMSLNFKDEISFRGRM